MSRTRALCLLLVCLASGGFAEAAASPADPGALSPSAVAWYDATYQSTTAPPPPSPSDVPAGGGYIAGVRPPAAPLPVPISLPLPAQPLAVMGLSYVLPPGVTATTLTLRIVGTASSTATGAVPSFAAPMACAASGVVVNAGRQPFAALPAHDCSRSSLATEAPGTLTFSDIGHLQYGTHLTFVIFPGTVDRLAIAPPSGGLATAIFSATPSAPGSAIPGVPPGATGSSVPVGSTGGQPAGSEAPGALGPALSAGGPLAAPGSTAPRTAGGTGSSGIAPAQVRAAAALIPRSRLGLAQMAAGLLALVLLAVVLIRTDGEPLLTPLGDGAAALGGVGRFRSPRSGVAPQL